jgi:CarD family transcriptional regulator
VYPAHGVAEVLGSEPRTIDGEKVDCLIFSLPQRGWSTRGGMTVSVPESRVDDVGIREAVSVEDADDVLKVLAVTDARVPSNWSRRFKNHQEKLKSGDVFQCAEVVRNLANRQRSGKLSTAETSMYANARHLLASELAVSWGIDHDAAEERVDGALGI